MDDIVSQSTATGLRCPLCIATIRSEIEMVPANAWSRDLLAGFDGRIARITFPDRAWLAGHLVESHGWKLRSE